MSVNLLSPAYRTELSKLLRNIHGRGYPAPSTPSVHNWSRAYFTARIALTLRTLSGRREGATKLTLAMSFSCGYQQVFVAG